MIDKQNKMTMKNLTNVSDLKKYVGDMITYKGYKLRVSDVSAKGMTCYDPNSGNSATISLDKAAEIIRMKYVTA